MAPGETTRAGIRFVVIVSLFVIIFDANNQKGLTFSIFFHGKRQPKLFVETDGMLALPVSR